MLAFSLLFILLIFKEEVEFLAQYQQVILLDFFATNYHLIKASHTTSKEAEHNINGINISILIETYIAVILLRVKDNKNTYYNDIIIPITKTYLLSRN